MNAPLNQPPNAPGSGSATDSADPDSAHASAHASAHVSAGASVNVSVNVSVNGEARTLTGPVSLADLVATLTQAPSGVAAALNETVVPRGEWATTVLGEGDRVEVLTAVQGG
ncbi:sulfur carrier protein ThiS [Streptomyces sp. NPDC053431]|uniref:sulfur carrier protein ThiS n=1 Tax=Streptomyces sp. NPDC053431 TaxID=3365703 RepID=UPI0037D236EE